MSLNIQDAQAAVAAVGPVQPVPLSERVQARQPQSRPQEAFEATLADVAPVDLDLPPTPDDAAAAVAREAMTRRDDGERSAAGASSGAPLLAGALPTVTLQVPISMLDTPAPRLRPGIPAQPAMPKVVQGTVPMSDGANTSSGSVAVPPSTSPAVTAPPSANPAIATAQPLTPAVAVVQGDAASAPATAVASDAASTTVQAPRPATPTHRVPAAVAAQASAVSPASAARSQPVSAPMQGAGAKPGQAAPAAAQSPSDDKPTRSDAAAPPAAITAPTSTATQSETGADSQSLADARRADANVGTRQQVRAVRQAEALQTAMVQRAEAASQIQVSFSSWGAGHSVTARLDGGRLHMQPSSARVGQALSAAAAPAGVELQIAVDGTDTATDERRQRRGDQGHA
ncbi:hypothetical protein [Stenotrophomonas sp. VV52]|uniref:SpaN/EivJ family type III secretion system needle length determinant n=1 Tax=Stenotrophomonas sp. VV52 TaxID=2066958 RepID=UPI0011AF051A|nr:hypothetical protein [Stenotrophomonas sp. VV52]